ncbi:hypothetical protein L0337_16005 [candidate division KSB1 bacterium]|nr:hypothetical protein [candidate division KSB1 bacterium]
MSTTLRNSENHQPFTTIGLSTINDGAASSAKKNWLFYGQGQPTIT